MASRAERPVEFKEFLGLRNTTSPERFALGDLQAALNVDIDDAKRITRRAGLTERLTGATHSLWSDGVTCLAVQGSTLKRVRATGSSSYAFDTMRSSLTAGLRMDYWSVNDCVYYANGAETGVIQAGASRSWGLTPPSGQPGAQAIGGGLEAGRYRYALTYLRGDGQESGTGQSDAIDLTERAGIRFTSIPVSSDATVTRKAIYLTSTNGEQLYRAVVMENSETQADYRNESLDLKVPLRTQFGQPAPAGHMVSWFRGHALVAQGPVLWPSEPYRYELFMLDKHAFMFPADINLLAPVEDGIFVGADQTYFLSGAGPEQWARSKRTVAGYGAIPYTRAYEPAEGDDLGEGVAGRVAMWASPQGHCMGANGGAFRNLTSSRFSYPTAQRGAGIVRQTQGYNQYLAVLEGTGAANNAFSGD